MSVEVANIVNGAAPAANDMKNERDLQLNGLSNGHHSKHKSSSKDKHRDKDRDHHKSSSSSSKHHKSSSRDKHHSSSSSSGKDKHRDKERDDSKHHSSGSSSHDKDKDKHKSSSSHHKSSSSDKEKEKHRDKDRKESSSSSSSSKDKDRSHKSSSSGSKSSSRDKDRDKDRHHKSSSSSSKHKHSSSGSKSSSSSSKDKQSRETDLVDGEFRKPEPIQKSEVQITNVEIFKSELPRNDNDESCTGFDAGRDASSYNQEQSFNNKLEQSDYGINTSQASSCDYSMSQFKEDEPSFVVKAEASEEDEQDSDSMRQYDNSVIKEENGVKKEESDEETEEQQPMEEDDEDDDDDVPLLQRKAKANAVIKEEEDDELSDEDVPLAQRKSRLNLSRAVKKEEPEEEDDEDEEMPLSNRKKAKEQAKQKVKAEKKKKRQIKEEEEEEEYEQKPKKKKTKKAEAAPITESPTKRAKKEKKEEEEHEVWRWWEEEKREDGVKWHTLEHKGPLFAPPYERLPKNVRFYYDGKPMELSQDTEEAAGFYAKMLNHDYCTKQVFNDNFFKDFRKTMTAKEKEIIKDFKKCNFMEMHQFFVHQSEQRKNATKEEKAAKKAENEALVKEYGFCMIDGHKEKIGNFRLEPPGLFRGRGEHPKMGMIKRRLEAEDILINCSKDSKIPEPPKGHRWKEVRHDNTVTWLASWVENVQGQGKYIMLNPSSKLKGEKDHIKYETARRLAKSIDKIRATYRDEWKSKEMRVRQRAVALYFIDKLALRAGNEKDEDQADTVGCCSLRVEHIRLIKKLDDKENVVEFDFLGKDSIRYFNQVEVEKRVFKNLELFMENKKEGDDLFDRLNTQVLNEHLKELMEGLTAKVFRTYNASITLQDQLEKNTDPNSSIPEKLLAYNRANRAVAILCNHQRAVPKGHEKSMEKLKENMTKKIEAIADCEAELNDLKKAAKRGSVKERMMADKKAKQLERLKQQMKQLEIQEKNRDENKTVALGTSKLNYLDPRISVAWCKKHGVPIEKIFNKTQRDKFLWAIHMADENYVF